MAGSMAKTMATHKTLPLREREGVWLLALGTPLPEFSSQLC